MVETYKCPHAQAEDGHSSCVYAGMYPIIVKLGEDYSCKGGQHGRNGKIIEVTNCAYLHELNLLEKIAKHVDDSNGGLI